MTKLFWSLAAVGLAVGTLAACSRGSSPDPARLDLVERHGAASVLPPDVYRPEAGQSLVALAARPSGKDWRRRDEQRCLDSGLPDRLSYVRGGGKAPRVASGLGGFFSGFSPKSKCGALRPLKVSAAAGGGVRLSPTATLQCGMVPAVDDWVANVVVPAARREFGQDIVSLRVAASYGCRTRNNKRGERLSEHSFANAIDFSAFTLADGRVVTVLEGWNGRRDERAFLRRIHRGACGLFSTVLGPNSDRYHRDHFHFDRAMHGRRADSTYCR